MNEIKDTLQLLKDEFKKNGRLSEEAIKLSRTLTDTEMNELKRFAFDIKEDERKQSIDLRINHAYKSLLKVQKERIAADEVESLIEAFDNDNDYKMNELLVKVIQSDDVTEESKDKLRVMLLQKNMSLVGKVLQRYARNDDGKISTEDLQQEGAIAFFRAIDTFDPDRGIKFSTYATTIMKNAICGLFTHKINRIREKEYSLNKTVNNTKSSEPTELMDFVADNDLTPIEVSHQETFKKVLYEAINQLQPDRKFIAYVRYELGGVKKASQFEIAAFTGATQTNISKIELAMKNDLEAYLNSKGINGSDFS